MTSDYDSLYNLSIGDVIVEINVVNGSGRVCGGRSRTQGEEGPGAPRAPETGRRRLEGEERRAPRAIPGRDQRGRREREGDLRGPRGREVLSRLRDEAHDAPSGAGRHARDEVLHRGRGDRKRALHAREAERVRTQARHEDHCRRTTLRDARPQRERRRRPARRELDGAQRRTRDPGRRPCAREVQRDIPLDER